MIGVVIVATIVLFLVFALVFGVVPTLIASPFLFLKSLAQGDIGAGIIFLIIAILFYGFAYAAYINYNNPDVPWIGKET